MKTVVEMAEDVGAGIADLPLEDAVLFEVDILSGRSAKLEAFAELIRADERKRFRIDDLEMLLKVRAEQIVSLQDEIRNLMGEE